MVGNAESRPGVLTVNKLAHGSDPGADEFDRVGCCGWKLPKWANRYTFGIFTMCPIPPLASSGYQRQVTESSSRTARSFTDRIFTRVPFERPADQSAMDRKAALQEPIRLDSRFPGQPTPSFFSFRPCRADFIQRQVFHHKPRFLSHWRRWLSRRAARISSE